MKIIQAALYILAGIFVFGLSLQARNTDKIAKVISVQGETSIVSPNAPIKAGKRNAQFPANGVKLTTKGSNSRIQVATQDGSRLYLGPNTEVSIHYAGDKAEYTLHSGQIGVDAGRNTCTIKALTVIEVKNAFCQTELTKDAEGKTVQSTSRMDSGQGSVSILANGTATNLESNETATYNSSDKTASVATTSPEAKTNAIRDLNVPFFADLGDVLIASPSEV